MDDDYLIFALMTSYISRMTDSLTTAGSFKSRCCLYGRVKLEDEADEF